MSLCFITFCRILPAFCKISTLVEQSLDLRAQPPSNESFSCILALLYTYSLEYLSLPDALMTESPPVINSQIRTLSRSLPCLDSELVIYFPLRGPMPCHRASQAHRAPRLLPTRTTGVQSKTPTSGERYRIDLRNGNSVSESISSGRNAIC